MTHPDDEELDRSHAAMTASTKQRQRSSIVEMSLVAGAAVLIAVSTMFSAWNTWELRRLAEQGAETRDIILEGTKCLVEQLAEHRHLNAIGHRAAAKDHGYKYPIPPEEEPPPVPGQLQKSCAKFINSTTSTSSP